MSEDPAFYRSHGSTSDGAWSARFEVSDDPLRRMALIIEESTPDGPRAVRLPLTPARARELRRLLAEMLKAGPTGGSRWGALKLPKPPDEPA